MPPLQTTGAPFNNGLSVDSQAVSLLTLDLGLVRGLAKGHIEFRVLLAGDSNPSPWARWSSSTNLAVNWKQSASGKKANLGEHLAKNAPANRDIGHDGSAEKLSRSRADQHAFGQRTTDLKPWTWAFCPTKHCVEPLVPPQCGLRAFVDESVAPKPPSILRPGNSVILRQFGGLALSPSTITVLQSLEKSDSSS